MKTRIGFVTNSSSSSFILAYNSKNVVSEIWEQLESKYDEIQAGEYLGYLMEYLNKADNEAENIDDFLSEQADNFRWEKLRIESKKELKSFATILKILIQLKRLTFLTTMNHFLLWNTQLFVT